jgi:hypothetical protein
VYGGLEYLFFSKKARKRGTQGRMTEARKYDKKYHRGNPTQLNT